jgi:hypothetical protein
MAAAAAPPLTLDLARGEGWKRLYERELDALDRLRSRRRMTESALGALLGFSGFGLTLLIASALAFPSVLLAAWTALDKALAVPWLAAGLAALAAILFPLVVLLCATLFLSRIEWLRRKQNEQEARVTFCEIARGKAKAYALCLRPAETLALKPSFGKRIAKTAGFIAVSPFRLLTRRRQDRLRAQQTQLFLDRSRPEALDAAILCDLLPEMPVLVLGFSDGGTPDVTGRLSPEDEAWNETVSLLLSGAARIFCKPDLSGGPVWELGRLMPLGVIERTVFVMPPAALMPGHPELHERTWGRIAFKAASFGLHFPAWSPEGLFFRFTPDGTHRVSLPFKIGAPGEFRQLHEALAALASKPEPDLELEAALEEAAARLAQISARRRGY